MHQGAGRGEDRPTEVTGHQAQSTACFGASGGWRPLAAACPQVRCHCPSSPSRPPRLLFLGLSLGIVCATIVRGRLAKSPDALQSTRQLQQQGNELEREGECEREGRGSPTQQHGPRPRCAKRRTSVQNEAGFVLGRVSRGGVALSEQHTPRSIPGLRIRRDATFVALKRSLQGCT